MQITLEQINEALTPTGLITLGAFVPQAGDHVAGADDHSTLVLVGNAGPGMWRVFSKSHIDQNEQNPLDSWSRQVLGDVSAGLAARFGLSVQTLFPFEGPPYMPFQRWALRSGDVHPSPLGPMIHNTYGMWHAYRGAFVMAAKIELDDTPPSASPCLSCAEKPCLNSCPVNAFSLEGYDVPACLDELGKDPHGPCLSASCLARRACPVGRDYIYEPAHARFHMQKFLASQRS